jgi:hypothetical protein
MKKDDKILRWPETRDNSRLDKIRAQKEVVYNRNLYGIFLDVVPTRIPFAMCRDFKDEFIESQMLCLRKATPCPLVSKSIAGKAHHGQSSIRQQDGRRAFIRQAHVN